LKTAGFCVTAWHDVANGNEGIQIIEKLLEFSTITLLSVDE